MISSNAIVILLQSDYYDWVLYSNHIITAYVSVSHFNSIILIKLFSINQTLKIYMNCYKFLKYLLDLKIRWYINNTKNIM